MILVILVFLGWLPVLIVSIITLVKNKFKKNETRTVLGIIRIVVSVLWFFINHFTIYQRTEYLSFQINWY